MSTLTKPQIEQASGRELDALIHSSLFNPDEWVVMKRGLFYRPGAKGYTSNEAEAGVYTEAEAREHEHPHDEPVSIRRKTIPAYSTSGDAMICVLRAIWGLGLRCHLWHTPDGECFAEIHLAGRRIAETCAVEPPEAVARVALLAILAREEAA